VVSGGIPDTVRVRFRLQDTGTCGLYGTGAWQPPWLSLFRRVSRVYVVLDRDATSRAIVLARTFGPAGASSSRRRSLATEAI
jgi:hypothetical protein